jgi:hypothetical protein
MLWWILNKNKPNNKYEIFTKGNSGEFPTFVFRRKKDRLKKCVPHEKYDT